MTATLKAELLKLRTTRTFFVLVGSALALSLLVIVLIVFLSDESESWHASDLFSIDIISTFVLLLGVIGMTGEWRHRTITSSVLAAPDRIRLLAAKVIAYAAAGALLSLIVTLVSGLVGTLLLSMRSDVTIGLVEILDVLWRNVAVAALLGALGVGVGAVLRNQVAAVIGVIVFTFIVESTVFAFAPDVGRYGPTASATGIQLGGEELSDEDFELLSPGLAALVALAWNAVFFAIGALTLRRRDLT